MKRVMGARSAWIAAAIVAALLGVIAVRPPLGVVLLLILVAFTIVAMRISRRYVLQRLVSLIPVLLAVTFLSFIMLDLLPGDPAISILGNDATPEAIAEFRAENQLDDPVVTRYLRWLGDAAQGDLGTSPILQEDVVAGLGRTLPVSLQFMVYAQVVALLLAIPLGIYSAYRAGRPIDSAISTTSFGILAIPNFVLALLFIFFFALGGFSGWGWTVLPATGHVPFAESPTEHLTHWVLPVMALALGQAVVYMRLLRTDMIATLQEDYIKVARAKGLRDRRILLKHALKPSSFTLLTVAGVNIGALVGGAIVLETMFTLPGVGTHLASAVARRDWLVVQGVVAVLAIGFVFANFAVDIIYAVLDPRIRHARSVA